jgi:excisionase family DNA binding protein
MSSGEEILTLDQAAAYLQISRATLYRLIKSGEIPGRRVGRRYRFSRRALLEWVEEKEGK